MSARMSPVDVVVVVASLAVVMAAVVYVACLICCTVRQARRDDLRDLFRDVVKESNCVVGWYGKVLLYRLPAGQGWYVADDTGYTATHPTPCRAAEDFIARVDAIGRADPYCWQGNLFGQAGPPGRLAPAAAP